MIQTEESFNLDQNPDEVFLLNSVEQLITGNLQAAGKNMKFVKFIFRGGLNPVLIKFPDNSDYEQFINKVKLIIRFNWLQEPNQFIMN